MTSRLPASFPSPFQRQSSRPHGRKILGRDNVAEPVIKGYLRVGAYIGDGAVIDHQFGTTDVFVIMPVEAINTRYFAHFGSPDELSAPIPAEFGALN